ncbi:NUDIX hydrolase [Caulobacter vibrioides]|uniref:MutT/nudix family protein n=2 Tax=Caulobacter vibrioides TaxID=155892 RepID=Q9A324_CAUVC|nr:NUDIX hydrolase [Caulobacter vibrioides]YP_002518866.1 ADP-ribose pyrophosphatase, nudix family [Caulobacter vibrioides NA1000]AAK25344.1 MutT/nudix family protein [Caulobacter vibrioides CB15]ACL96958.1 ADP-ribose pyrophosphatase, nudix family [Caulobacter vibrioides NA1000]ATC30204.1 phosphohydrolase [Caulobacter vibrioides]QXZ51729.1 NUDIX hydrolase [Caulobacter vibrioides]
MSHPVPTVGVVCLRGEEVLLIKRGTPPRLGQWSVPGGRLEWGEALQDAALRELKEETGVDAELLGLIDVIDGVFPARPGGEITRHYVLIDYAARWTGGDPVAGDDAAEARFVTRDEAMALVEWEETRRVITEAVERFGGLPLP